MNIDPPPPKLPKFAWTKIAKKKCQYLGDDNIHFDQKKVQSPFSWKSKL